MGVFPPSQYLPSNNALSKIGDGLSRRNVNLQKKREGKAQGDALRGNFKQVIHFSRYTCFSSDENKGKKLRKLKWPKENGT